MQCRANHRLNENLMEIILGVYVGAFDNCHCLNENIREMLNDSYDTSYVHKAERYISDSFFL